MTAFKASLFRLAGIAVGVYLACDAGVGGPVFRFVLERVKGDAVRVVARVGECRITRGQVERAMHENLWLDGQTVAELAPEQLTQARQAALEGLIDDTLLRREVAAAQLPVDEAEIDRRLRRLVNRFGSQEGLETALRGQGLGRLPDVRARLAARFQQEQYLAQQVGARAAVTDAEARAWFEANAQSLVIPERVAARHIFLPTLDHPSDEAKAKLESAQADLRADRKDFATLAREVSEDPATKDQGGQLGWMTRRRLPDDFAEPVFALQLHQPTLLRTHIGWHLVEVTGRKPAEPRSFEQAKSEVIAALEAVKRRQAVADFRQALRHVHSAEIRRGDLN